MKKIISALAVGIGLSLIGCPPAPQGSDKTPGTDTTPPAAGTDTTPPPADAPKTDAPAEKLDLAHVKAGQKYTYKMTNAGAPAMEMVYIVKEVGPDFVKYQTQTLMDMGQGLNPVGDPTDAPEWKYTPAPATTTTQTTDAPKADIAYEEVTVSGIKFNAMVVTSGNTKSWMSMSGSGKSTIPTFPGVLKTQTDGNTTMELVKVE